MCIDKRMYFERKNLVNLLKYVGGGIESRENSIKEYVKVFYVIWIRQFKTIQFYIKVS